ncbi:MAG: peptidase M28, partial [Gemmatimonadetes bacterium]|nr:peptidase M28 [Gemmatimonadota bacterium]
MRRILGLVATLALVGRVDGTGQAAPGRAAATITEADIKRRIGIIAHDSMGGRDTPSPGLESTARYLAREFER